MQQLAGYRKERPLVLGEHTPISIARSTGKWKKIPYLRENDGMLPPSMIVVGDRRRVIAAAKLLKQPMLLHKEVGMLKGEGKAGGGQGAAGTPAERMAGHLRMLDRVRLAIKELRSIRKDAAEIHTSNASGTFAIDVFSEYLNSRILKFGEKCLDPISLSEGVGALMRFYELQPHSTLYTRLHRLRAQLAPDAGRVHLAIGVYEHQGRPLPLTVLETQMGMSAQDINAWEAMVNSREDGYMLEGRALPASGLGVIRAGTCGGIILGNGANGRAEEPKIDIGDVIIAHSSIGDGAVLRQRLGCQSAFDPEGIARFRAAWAERGMEFTSDGLWPIAPSTPKAISALSESCSELGLSTHQGANFSKESLYLEGDEGWVKSLRTKYSVLSTEMEHLGLVLLAKELGSAGIPVSQGLVSTVVGTVPGGSFAEPGSPELEKADRAQERMLEATMRALWKLAYGN